MSRPLWFVAGAGAGVYAASRARRALDSLSAEGLRNRWHGLTHAARVAGEELHAARSEREAELRDRLGLGPATPQLASPPRHRAAPLAQQTPDPEEPELLPADDTRDRA